KALGGPKCPVCAAVLEDVRDYMLHHQYALDTDAQAQAAFAAAGGFCHFHAWQLDELASPRTMSAALPTLAARMAGELERSARRPPYQRPALDDLPLHSPACGACEVR